MINKVKRAFIKSKKYPLHFKMELAIVCSTHQEFVMFNSLAPLLSLLTQAPRAATA